MSALFWVSICSACFGSLSSVMIQDSAIIILFATILGAGDMLSMITTSTQGIASCLLLIPAAFLSGKLGYKKTIMQFTAIGAVMIMLLASRRKVMGSFRLSVRLKILGWTATLVMAAAAVGMFATMGR